MYCQYSCQSRFSGVYLVFEVFQDTSHSNKEILVYTGMLPPVLCLNGLKLYKFVSRSDLVLISFWMLTIPWTKLLGIQEGQFQGNLMQFEGF